MTHEVLSDLERGDTRDMRYLWTRGQGGSHKVENGRSHLFWIPYLLQSIGVWPFVAPAGSRRSSSRMHLLRLHTSQKVQEDIELIGGGGRAHPWLPRPLRAERSS